MKETENLLLGHLSIFDSWLKLYKAPCRGQFRIFRSKLKGMYWVVFTHLRLSWLESPENNIKGIKSLSQIENNAWSVTVGKFSGAVFFFLSSVNPLIYSRKMRHVFHAIMEILRNIMPHPHQWGNKDIVKKLSSTTCTTILKVRMNLYDLSFFAIVNLRLVPLSECALISRVTGNGACE